MTSSNRSVGIMIDLESLDLSPKSAVTQIGIIAYPLADPESEIRRIEQYLPVQPQMALGRTISFSTILFWMKQEDKARLRFIDNDGNDMEELLALVRSVHRKLTDIINQAGGRDSVEIWSRGPQFDIVNLETLFVDCGLEAPWKYDSVRDLRTYMTLAGVKTEELDQSGIVPHVAISDCVLQIRGYIEATRRLRANV